MARPYGRIPTVTQTIENIRTYKNIHGFLRFFPKQLSCKGSSSFFQGRVECRARRPRIRGPTVARSSFLLVLPCCYKQIIYNIYIYIYILYVYVYTYIYIYIYFFFILKTTIIIVIVVVTIIYFLK